MAQTWMTSALVAAALAWAAPSISSACSMHKPGEPCPCKHHQKAQTDEKAPAPKPEPTQAGKQGHTGLLAPLHSNEVAAKCTCSGPADCTCKKGTCKCPKCDKHRGGRVVEQLQGARDALRLPANARSDASAGMFI